MFDEIPKISRILGTIEYMFPKLAFGSMLFLLAASSVTFGQADLAPSDKRAVLEFENSARDYIQLRTRAASEIQRAPNDATPEEIQAYKKQLQQAIISARAVANKGDLFRHAVRPYIRRVILKEFPGFKMSSLRRDVLAAANKGVRLRINAVYPETAELLETPPSLLLALPQLPPELRYRFVGRALVLLDRDAGLILDYLKDALP